jgi:hypothetical protein
MVSMRRLTIEVDDDTYGWIERRRLGGVRGRSPRFLPDDGRAGTDAGIARMHDDMARRLDELGQCIRRLDRDLRERTAIEKEAPSR